MKDWHKLKPALFKRQPYYRPGCDSYGIELNPAYVDVAVQRWQDFTGEAALLESSGQSFDTLKSGNAVPVKAETVA